MTNREDELLANIEPTALNCGTNNITNAINNHITSSPVVGSGCGGGGSLTKLNNTTAAATSNNTTVVNGDCIAARLTASESIGEPNENITTIINNTDNSLIAKTANNKVVVATVAATLNGIESTVPPLQLQNGVVNSSSSSCSSVATTTTSSATTTAGTTTSTSGINEFWSENPPSSASSGFSDDDSLAGQEGDPKTIEQIVQMVKERGRQGLIKEYSEIRNRAPEGTFVHARIRNNLVKNRYTDVLCYDHTRVVLSRDDGDDESSDYINANFVDGYKQKNAYISTQGPLPKTSQDFWRMIWEQHCLVVVMTTRVMERGRVKCGQYWEPTEDSSLEFGNFHVRTISIETNEDYTVASLELRNIKTDEVRKVSHWQFTCWPDYGVPNSAMAMLNFLQKVRDKQAEMVRSLGDTWAGHPRGPPIVVHCSAGIGRTGTFITLDICISRLEDVGTADIRGTVEKIRSQRAYSIQMPDQYVFCHVALIEYAISRGMLKSADLTGFIDRDEDSE